MPLLGSSTLTCILYYILQPEFEWFSFLLGQLSENTD